MVCHGCPRGAWPHECKAAVCGGSCHWLDDTRAERTLQPAMSPPSSQALATPLLAAAWRRQRRNIQHQENLHRIARFCCGVSSCFTSVLLGACNVSFSHIYSSRSPWLSTHFVRGASTDCCTTISISAARHACVSAHIGAPICATYLQCCRLCLLVPARQHQRCSLTRLIHQRVIKVKHVLDIGRMDCNGDCFTPT